MDLQHPVLNKLRDFCICKTLANDITNASSIQFGDVDPDDLLSFLDPPGASGGPDLSTPPSSGSNASVASSGPSSAPPPQPPPQSATQPPQQNPNDGAKSSRSGGPDEDLLNLIDNYE